MSKRNKTGVGAAVAAWGDAVELVEEVYRDAEGEVDAGSEAVERMVDRLGEQALEKLARFIRFCEAQHEGQMKEIDRAQAATKRIEQRREWAEQQALRILGDAKKRTAGPFLVRRKIGSERVASSKDLDLEKLPPSLVRVTPEQIVPASKALDKRAAKAYLQDGDSLPVAGIWIERGPDKIKID